MRIDLVALVIAVVALVIAVLAIRPFPDAPEAPNNAGLEGQYVGYSWEGEADGLEFDEAERYIETILELDEEGIIQNATMRYFDQIDGYWTTRQSGNAGVWVDYDVEPTAAELTEDGIEEDGDTMFRVHTANLMSFYAAGVDADSGYTAVAFVEPWSRLQFELKLEPGYNFEDTTLGELTVDSEEVVPTVLTSGGGTLQGSWEAYEGVPFYELHDWSHVVTDRGTFEGMGEDTTVATFLEAMGVEFQNGEPQPMDVAYGYHSIGGWAGNYEAITEYLEGEDATELTSLVDWEVERWADAVDEENRFGIDVPTGATGTAQDSMDGISGATVRMSRESTSYQRALVEAGILEENDVIIGRF